MIISLIINIFAIHHCRLRQKVCVLFKKSVFLHLNFKT
jgi:hypothetical protein